MIAAFADLIVAIGGVTALFGVAGGGIYVARRRMNGHAVLPGSGHDRELDALRDIERAIRDGTEQTSSEHASMMYALGFTEGHQWVKRKQ